MVSATARGGWDRGLVQWFSEQTHHGVVATDHELRVVMWNRWMEIHSGIAAADAMVELIDERQRRLAGEAAAAE